MLLIHTNENGKENTMSARNCKKEMLELSCPGKMLSERDMELMGSIGLILAHTLRLKTMLICYQELYFLSFTTYFCT